MPPSDRITGIELFNVPVSDLEWIKTGPADFSTMVTGEIVILGGGNTLSMQYGQIVPGYDHAGRDVPLGSFAWVRYWRKK